MTFQLPFHRMDRSRSHHAVIRVYDEAGNGERFGFTREHDVGLLLRELVR